VYTALFVDDEPLILEGLATIIDWAAHGVQPVGSALDGEGALAILRRQRIDILITDIRMPECDGLALLREVRRVSGDTRVIIVSGYDDFEYVREAAILGIENYLLKPLDREELEATVIATVAKITELRDTRRIALEGLEVMRNTILLRTLFGTIGPDTLAEKLDVLKLPPLTPGYVVASLAPRAATREIAERLPNLSWPSILHDALIRGSFHPVAPPRADRLILLLYNQRGERGGEDAQRILTDVRAFVESVLGCSCRGERGTMVETISEIPVSYQAAEELLRLMSAGGPDEAADQEDTLSLPGEVSHPLLRHALRYILENLHRGLALKTIAAELGHNPAYLGQLFRRELGCSFNDCLNALRVRKARLLLRQTHYRVTEISSLVGFTDPQYFDRIFKQHTGRTPSEYRGSNL
jgi:YesN/AraC family two-component response regulator